MRSNMVEAEVAPLAGTVEVARSHGRAKFARLAAPTDSAAFGGAFDPTVKFMIANRHLSLPLSDPETPPI